MDEQIVSLILGLVGAGGGLWVGVKEFTKWKSGRALEERKENQSLVDRALLAEIQMEWEAKGRRITQDYAAVERRKVIGAGLAPDAWPNLDKILGPKPQSLKKEKK